MKRLYITACLARVQSARIVHGPWGMVAMGRHIRAIVASPEASSDMLLIVADTLRLASAAPDDTPPAHRAALRAWADTLSDLAPTRATPIEDAA
jgi:hypothetical protein